MYDHSSHCVSGGVAGESPSRALGWAIMLLLPRTCLDACSSSMSLSWPRFWPFSTLDLVVPRRQHTPHRSSPSSYDNRSVRPSITESNTTRRQREPSTNGHISRSILSGLSGRNHPCLSGLPGHMMMDSLGNPSRPARPLSCAKLAMDRGTPMWITTRMLARSISMPNALVAVNTCS